LAVPSPCTAPAVFGPGDVTNACSFNTVWSNHSGGAHFAFADGSVRFLTHTVTQPLAIQPASYSPAINAAAPVAPTTSTTPAATTLSPLTPVLVSSSTLTRRAALVNVNAVADTTTNTTTTTTTISVIEALATRNAGEIIDPLD